MSHQLEYFFGVTDVIRQAYLDSDELPGDITRFLNRAQGTLWSQLNGDKWWLARAWFDVAKYVNNEPYNGSRDAFQYDRGNPVIAWNNALFTKYYYPAQEGGMGLRPAAAFWFDTGMQYGTRYRGFVGPDVDTDSADWLPEYPYDYARLKNYIPPLIIYDDDGNEVSSRNVVWDHPSLTNTHQCWATQSSSPDAKRRWYQETDHTEKLDSNAFGTTPWAPQSVQSRRRAES